jgi:dTDP-4-dehydrorhamnose reductase
MAGMFHVAIAGIAGHVGDALRRFRPDDAKITGLVHKRATVSDGLVRVVEGFDVTDERHVLDVVRNLAHEGARTLVNCVAQVDLDGIENQRHTADPTSFSGYALNTRGAAILANACAQVATEGLPILLLHLSTESVFGDSPRREKYAEDDPLTIPSDRAGGIDYADVETMPTFYGLTKALGELAVFERYRDGAVVVRMHGVQGPHEGFFARTVADIRKSEPFTRVNDMHVAHLPDSSIAEALFAIEKAMHDPNSPARGIYHLSARTALTPYEIALRFVESLHKPKELITPILLEQLIEAGRASGKQLARRPHYTILAVEKFERDFYRLPTAEESIDRFLELYADTSP